MIEIDWQVVGRQGVQIPLIALLGGPDCGLVPQESDPPVPVADQVRNPTGGTPPVVGDDGVDSAVRRRSVEKHDCGAVSLPQQQRCQIAWGRDDDHAVDSPVHELVYQSAGACRFLVAASGQYGHSAG